MRITISQSNINSAIPGDPKNCPVAQHLREAGVSFKHVSQNVQTCRHRNHGGKIILSPTDIRHFPVYVAEILDNFDSGKVIKPFEFETLD